MAFALLIAAGAGIVWADEPSLAGRVLDTLGNGVPRVEVLVLEHGPGAPQPLAAVVSDAEGYFRIASLLPGAYRIAALKDGYLTFVGAVDTAARRSVQLVLQPAGAADDDPTIPDDASWALRLPRRSLLRDSEPRPLAEDGLPAAAASSIDTARLELDQAFGVSPTGASSESVDALDSSDTRVRVAVPLGERGSVALSGSRERHRATGREAVADRRGRAVRVDVRYDALPGGRLDVNAFYETREFSLGSGALHDADDGFAQQQGSVGYEASWTQRLDERSSLAFGVDYSDVWLETPAAYGGPERGAWVGSRVLGAESSYRRSAGTSHDLSVTVRARLLEWPQLSGIADGPTGGRERRPDLDVAFDAEDRWSSGAPWTLVYGIGYRESLVDGGVRVTRPRVGGEWASGSMRIAAELSYHDVTGPDAVSADELGYEATVEVPLAGGVSVHGLVRQAPVELSHVRYDGAASGTPIYLSDGAAAVHERTVSIVQSSGRSSTSVEVASGHAQGRLSAFVPYVDADDVAARGVAFDSARVGLRLPNSGTDLALEYRRLVSESAEPGPATGPATLRSLEMRVRKNLWDVASSGDWRLLVALSLDSFETDDLERWRARADAVGDGDSFDALNRRVSAGVSVAF